MFILRFHGDETIIVNGCVFTTKTIYGITFDKKMLILVPVVKTKTNSLQIDYIYILILNKIIVLIHYFSDQHGGKDEMRSERAIKTKVVAKNEVCLYDQVFV
jgi:hypothetical protein